MASNNAGDVLQATSSFNRFKSYRDNCENLSTRKVLKHAIRENMSARNKKTNKKKHEFAEEEVFSSKRNIVILFISYKSTSYFL